MDKTFIGSLASYGVMTLAIVKSLPEVVAIVSGIAGSALAITGAMLKYAQYKKTMVEIERMKDENSEHQQG